MWRVSFSVLKALNEAGKINTIKVRTMRGRLTKSILHIPF